MNEETREARGWRGDVQGVFLRTVLISLLVFGLVLGGFVLGSYLHPGRNPLPFNYAGFD